MRIRTKLALGLFAIALVLLLPLGLALRSLDRLRAATADLRSRDFAAAVLLVQMRMATDTLTQLELPLLFVHDSTTRVTVDAQVGRLRGLSDSLHALGFPKAAVRIRGAVDQLARYAPIEYEAAVRGDTALADSLSSHHFIPAIHDGARVLSVVESELRGQTSQRVERASDETATAFDAAAGGFIIASVLALIIAVILWRSISRPVRDFEAGMAAVADGNFGYRLAVSPSRRDEFGRLAQSFKTMAQQLAELDRLKAEFVSVASHELKTPINVILGYLQLLDEEVYGPLSTKQREVVRTVDVQTQSLARLVQQLLDVSRFEAGGGKLDLRPTSLDQFLAELEETFRVLALQRGIAFRVVRLGTLPDEVLWDPDRINEVLGNLLSNAFKFTERGGTVELLADAVDHAVQLTVHDTGAGIPPEHLPFIFKKFFQADNQEAATHGGTGLGLAIAREIVAAHGGTIAVDSTVGLGTTFQITLPVRAGRGGVRRRRSLPSAEVPA